MAKVTVGTLTTFNHEVHEWSVYKDRLEQWFLANELDEVTDKSGAKRRAILLSCLTEATYKLARDLALPNIVAKLSYADVVNLFDEHFESTSKKCGFAERYKFHSAVQNTNESMAEWAARVRGLAAHCEFRADSFGDLLRDRFVLGMVHGPERDKLFTTKMADVTLQKALEIAEGMRSARIGSQQGRSAAAGATTEVAQVPLQVLKMSAAPARSGAGHPRGQYAPSAAARPPPGADAGAGTSDARSGACGVCGYTGHQQDSCRFKHHVCKRCGVKGHLKRMCSKGVSRQYYVECGADDHDDVTGKRVVVCNIRSVQGEPMKESVVVNENTITFELDTGSPVTMIPESTYKSLFYNFPLQPADKHLQCYNGGPIDTLGTLNLPFRYKSVTNNITVHVARDEGPLLLGRDFISKFHLELCQVNFCKYDQLTSKYPKLFSNNLGCCKNTKVQLKIKSNTKPIFCRARPLPFALREKVEQELNRLTRLGILVPITYSEYASPIVPVMKQDKSLRLCADYSVSLNKHLLVEKYPLPRVDELFAKLNGGEQFSKLDLSSAYNQLVLSEDSQLLTTINTHKGLFMYTRLVFGLASAPAIFQRTMETLLAGLDGVLVYLDDILVTGKNQSEHVNKLHEVFRRLEAAGLVLQKEKCSFFLNSVSYLGYIIDKHGIHKSPDKVKAILEAKCPGNVSELKSFLGLVNYYRNFVENASSILSPLHELLQKNVPWIWKQEHDDAVNKIKKELSSDKNLAHFNPDADLFLTVDASPYGLAAILSLMVEGVEKPVSYASRSLSAAEKRYSQIEKEASAILFGIRKYHQYLYGRNIPFTLRTDHKPLLSIFNPEKGIPEVSANRLQRYAIFLSAYNYNIEYVSSSHNSADFLSRVMCEQPVLHIDDIAAKGHYVNFVYEGDRFLSLNDIKVSTQLDDTLSKVINFILNGWPNKIQELLLKPYYDNRSELAFANGLILKGHKLVVPQSMRSKITEELHRGHLGVHKMKAQARDRFWWPRLSHDIEDWVASCRVCAALRPAPARAPLTPWPFPPHSWHRVHVDLLGPINNRSFLVIVDAFSKWVECFDVSNNYSTRVIIERLGEVKARFGIFNVICSDNGSYFTSKEFKEFCTRNGIQHITSPTYNPASNGQAESYVKIIKRAIKAIIMSGSSGKDLNVKIQEFLFHYRNSKHSTTDRSPSELLFGRKLRSRLDLIAPQSVASSSAPLDVLVKEKQNQQSEQYRGSRKVKFEVGEQVLVQVHVNQNRQLVRGQIEKKIGSSVYIVQLLNLNRSVKKHTNQILKYKGEEEHVSDNSAVTAPAKVQPMVAEAARLSQPSSAADSVADDLQISLILSEHPAVTDMTPTAPPTDHLPRAGRVDDQPDQVEQETDGDRSLEYEDAGSGINTSDITMPPIEPEATEPTTKRLRKIVDYKPFF